MHRITNQEVIDTQTKYKQNYEPFRPFQFTDEHRQGIANRMATVITTQNGMDTDDYCVGDNNKIEKYLSSIPKGSKVLLLGTGTGREVLVAKELGLNAVGITFGSRNLDFGRKYLDLQPTEQVEALAEVLPFPKETFDVVAGFQIFEHTMMPMIFLLEQGRVLKYGGKLLLEWPPAKHYSEGNNPHHQICFTPGQAEALFHKAGFQDVVVYLSNDKTPISSENKWRGDQDDMLVIEGVKTRSFQTYINRIWSI